MEKFSPRFEMVGCRSDKKRRDVAAAGEAKICHTSACLSLLVEEADVSGKEY